VQGGAVKWLNEMMQDPDGSPSSTRWAAMLCVVVACGIAVYGRIVGNQQTETIIALLGGGAATFFSRTKSAGGTSG